MRGEQAKPPAHRQAFIDAVAGMAAEVYDFHRRWQQSIGEPEAVAGDRLGMLQEEVDELRAELVGAAGVVDRESVIDEAADVLFVAIGTLERFGEAGLSGMQRVTGKNAAKTEHTHYIRPGDGKISRRGR